MEQKRSLRIGFLVTHGTDTMAWGLSAIRYALKNLPSNVAITGSQVPISNQYSTSDVYPNIENSIKLLTQLSGPDIFVVFNNGQAAFQDDLWKVDKWSPDAFRGEELARINIDEIIIRGRAYPLNLNRKLDKLYLIRTGGTIESEKNKEGLLVPTSNLISNYITNRLDQYFVDFESISLMAVDSSDLVLDSWLSICRKIADVCKSTGYTTYIDEKFNPNVKVIATSPLMKEEEYVTLFEEAEGIILTAYGSGTINTDVKSGYSPLPAIEKATKDGKIVIISSHTPFGTQDFVYSNAWEPIKKGAIPAGDFSIAHCQMKLSYILGHHKELDKIAKQMKIAKDTLIKIAFLTGVDFRSNSSRKQFEKFLGYQIPLKDPFFNLPFSVAMRKINRYINKKETQKITIGSVSEFVSAYKKHFKNPTLRNKWAIILKPDTAIGSNSWGELLDASKNLATITSELLDWNIVTMELSEIDYDDFLSKIKEYCVNETLGEFLRSFRYVIIEGGRQSLYDAKSFDDISNKKFSRVNYIHLLQTLMLARSKPGSNPSLLLCLGHQGIAEAIKEYLIKLTKEKTKIVSSISKIDKEKAKEFGSLLQEITDIGSNIPVINNNNETVAKKFSDQYFAVKRNEIPEVGLTQLAKYKPSKDIVSTDILKEYQKIAKYHTGMLEDFYDLESLDIVMLHNDEVSEEAILFFNWVLSKLSKFIRNNLELTVNIPELDELANMPFGIEIPSSTLYNIDFETKEPLTEIAGMIIYYYNHKTGMIKRDYTLQFHPELFEEITILQKRDFESKTLLELTDGIQLLLSSLQAGFIETFADFHYDKE
ncbi:MAG: asparaginase domain-containing protein [Candidatus Heimdallarchaeota archaeon]